MSLDERQVAVGSHLGWQGRCCCAMEQGKVGRVIEFAVCRWRSGKVGRHEITHRACPQMVQICSNDCLPLPVSEGKTPKHVGVSLIFVVVDPTWTIRVKPVAWIDGSSQPIHKKLQGLALRVGHNWWGLHMGFSPTGYGWIPTTQLHRNWVKHLDIPDYSVHFRQFLECPPEYHCFDPFPVDICGTSPDLAEVAPKRCRQCGCNAGQGWLWWMAADGQGHTGYAESAFPFDPEIMGFWKFWMSKL